MGEPIAEASITDAPAVRPQLTTAAARVACLTSHKPSSYPSVDVPN